MQSRYESPDALPLTCSLSHNLVGTLALIHGSVLHKSEKNTSQRTRYAYTFHMIESPPFAKYDEKNWLQPTAKMPFTHLFDSERGVHVNA
jgi:phytanoyl-CoA hydroxylase